MAARRLAGGPGHLPAAERLHADDGSRRRSRGAVRVDDAGVDLLESTDGPVVMEVNSSPGLEGIQNATGVDVAEAIINLLEREVKP